MSKWDYYISWWQLKMYFLVLVVSAGGNMMIALYFLSSSALIVSARLWYKQVYMWLHIYTAAVDVVKMMPSTCVHFLLLFLLKALSPSLTLAHTRSITHSLTHSLSLLSKSSDIVCVERSLIQFQFQ